MATLLRRLSVAVFSLALIGFALWYARRPQPIPVRVHRVAHGEVEETVANSRVGSVKACRRSRLSPSVGGQIDRLYVREGERVKQGQLLLSLWNLDLKAQVALAKSEIEGAKAQAAATCLRADEARRQVMRLAPLQKRKLVSQETLDQANTRARALSQECRAAEVAVGVHQARLELTESQLAKTYVYAPFDGVVAEVYGEVGEYLTPSPPAVLTPPAIDLIAADCFYVTAPIDEIDSSRLKPGMEVRIHVDAFGAQKFAGRLKRIAPYVLEVEKQARTVEVEVEFLRPEEAALMRPGYSADVEIVLARRQDVSRIPTEAVMEGGRVLVLEAGRLVERQIETGLSNWNWTEVQKGLQTGDKVVLSLDREGVRAGALAVAEEEQ
ncbi:MAG: efflux RND transporter periplasmic adaptor subunit [Methylohalobius sp.]